jgi:glycosyltransferase involved in cell wall biosynthesis
LSVGNLIPTKGHALLLRAFADIAHEHPDCELHIIGDGPERQALMRLTQALVISSRVRFLEKQSRTAVADAMKRCAVFALPSSYEGLGGVYLEAMACAKPVIGCEGQGIADIIRHGSNGLLVPPHDELQLRNALGMLLQNAGLRARLGAAARESILQRHTLEQQATNFANLYRECVA